MRKVKVGIVGCGGIANGKHMPDVYKRQAYGVPSYWLAAGSVGLGQLVACYGVGLPLLLLARKRFTTL